MGMSEKIKLQIDPKGRDNSWQQLGAQKKKKNRSGPKEDARLI